MGRAVTTARLHFLMNAEEYEDEGAKCAYLATMFEGPALDWVSTDLFVRRTRHANFDAFVTAVREAFGVADNNITALLRRDLDALEWRSDVPVFFAEFDRLTQGLGITNHETRVAMVEQKLPVAMKVKLAEQALSFSNYETMRERLNLMWAMDPTRNARVTQTKKPRCGSCGKKGHTSLNCRAKK